MNIEQAARTCAEACTTDAIGYYAGAFQGQTLSGVLTPIILAAMRGVARPMRKEPPFCQECDMSPCQCNPDPTEL